MHAIEAQSADGRVHARASTGQHVCASVCVCASLSLCVCVCVSVCYGVCVNESCWPEACVCVAGVCKGPLCVRLCVCVCVCVTHV